MKDHLAEAFLPADKNATVLFRTGIVDNADPIQITIAAQTGLSSSWLQAYTENNPPSEQDQVLVYQGETDLIILGRIINGGE